MIIQSQILNLLYSFLLFLTISACNNENSSIKSPNISNIDINLKLIRADKLLFMSGGGDFYKNISNLHKEHYSFINHFSSEIMHFKAYNDTSTSYFNSIETFINHKDINTLFLDCDSVFFPDIKTEGFQIERAFKVIKYFYPKTKDPIIYTYISAFNVATYIAEDHIGVGLDFFLGPEYNKYKYSQHPQYLIKEFKKENLPIWIIKNYIEVNLPSLNSNTPSLLDHILYKGKNTLMLKYCFPNTKDHDLLGYSKEQIQWCKDNEREVWLFFSERNLLFEKDERKYHKFINLGPTTAGMPPEAPGNIGTWLGYMIIKSALKHKPDKDILWVSEKIKASQEFLTIAKYRP